MPENSREWTVMVFTMADSDPLKKAAVKTVRQIAATQLSKVKVVAQVTYEKKFKGHIRRHAFESPVPDATSPGHVDPITGLPFTIQPARRPDRSLQHFMQWAISTYPARRYCVVIQGHAWGADYRLPSLNSDRHAPVSAAGNAPPSHPHPKTRLLFGNPSSPNRISNRQLSDALLEGAGSAKIDLLGLDSCLMSMAEICCQFRECAKYVISPEGYGPLAGWPFDQIIPIFDRETRASTGAVSKLLLNSYEQHYSEFEPELDLTIALCDLQYTGELTDAVRNLAAILKTSMVRDTPERRSIIRCRVETESYRFPAYIDLFNFADRLGSLKISEPITMACEQVKNSLKNRFVAQYSLKRKNSHSYGLSIFFPQWEIGRKHKESSKKRPYHFVVATPASLQAAKRFIRQAFTEHDFVKATQWEAFLDAFVQARQVPPLKSVTVVSTTKKTIRK